VELRLQRFRGGDKGPVMLTPGFGTGATAYTITTTDTNFPEYLFEHGYDVWVLDYRASPELPSGATQFTLDDIAQYDYPAAVDTVLKESGADSTQIMAHCIGSMTMLMSMALGLKGVRSAVASQLTLHPRVGVVNKLRAGLHAADLIEALGVDTLTTTVDEDGSLLEHLYDKALAFYPSGDEPCDRPFCRRVMFMYGEVYDHDRLNEETHEHLDEAFGVANMTTFKLPIDFIHGEHNRLFLPEGSQATYEWLQDANGPELYSRTVIPDYAHMDCFIGEDAARDVYPVITELLDKHN
jgi:choline dehydrogenase-like flavoprotein